MRVAVALLAALALACGEDAFPPQPTNVLYQVTVGGCANHCTSYSGPVDSAGRGDTLLVRVIVTDTVAGDSVLVTLRQPCDTSAAVVAGRTVLRSFPFPVTCPDSTRYDRTVHGAVGGTEIRSYVWVVDSGLGPGTFILRGAMLESPPLAASATLVIR